MNLLSVKKGLLTPAVSPDFLLKKRNETKQQKAAAQPIATGSGSSPSFDDLYAETSAYFSPETVSYSPLGAGALTRLIAKSLRPAYDQAIERRRENTATYNANLDADAYARGIGSSSYVTDVKQRSYRDEARDVEALEASYGAQLAEKLYAALNEQADRQLEVDMFNAKQIDTAKQRAYSAASALYRASGGSGSFGGTKAESSGSTLPALSLRKTLNNGIDEVSAYGMIPTVPAEEAETYWKRLTPAARKSLLNASGSDDAQLLGTIEKSLGYTRFHALLQEYPAE